MMQWCTRASRGVCVGALGTRPYHAGLVRASHTSACPPARPRSPVQQLVHADEAVHRAEEERRREARAAARQHSPSRHYQRDYAAGSGPQGQGQAADARWGGAGAGAGGGPAPWGASPQRLPLSGWGVGGEASPSHHGRLGGTAGGAGAGADSPQRGFTSGPAHMRLSIRPSTAYASTSTAEATGAVRPASAYGGAPSAGAGASSAALSFGSQSFASPHRAHVRAGPFFDEWGAESSPDALRSSRLRAAQAAW